MREKLLRLAIAAMERMDVGGYGEAMCGDLLEELAWSGPTGRLWREVVLGMARGLWRWCGRWVSPLMFAAAWSALYPVWRWAEQMAVPESMGVWAQALDWPSSRIVELAMVGMPVLTYVWLGFLLSTMMLEELGSSARWFYVLRGMLLAPSVLLVSTLMLRVQMGQPGFGYWSASPTGLGAAKPMLSACLPVGLSLAVAIVAGREPRARAGRRPKAG